MVDQRSHLLPAIRRIQRFGTALHRITYAVRFRAPAPMPERVQRQTPAILRPRQQRFWHDRETAAHTSEAAVLGETAKLDCAFASAGNFEDRVRNLWIRDVSFICSIEEQNRAVPFGVFDPAPELLARRDRASRVVWEAKINKIDMFARRLGYEIVIRRARQINDPFVAAIRTRGSGVPNHHVGIDINWVNRIGNRNLVLIAENIENETAVTFRTVGDKNFVVGDVDVTVAIIVLRNGRS